MRLFITGLVLIACTTAVRADVDLDSLRDSVVSIEITAQPYDYYEPWNAPSPGGSGGSGFFIGERRLMTNAHVVSDAKIIRVKRPDRPEKYPARVLFIAHDRIEGQSQSLQHGSCILVLDDGAFMGDITDPHDKVDPDRFSQRIDVRDRRLHVRKSGVRLRFGVSQYRESQYNIAVIVSFIRIACGEHTDQYRHNGQKPDSA